jgi:hypothetical protein
LLGLSFPAECEEIESEFFADDDFFQEMLTTENDLIDAYARGELAGEELRRFERVFVNSLRGGNRVQFARAFAGAVAAFNSVETKNQRALLDVYRPFRLSQLSATIAILVLFIAVSAWLIIDQGRMINKLRELQAEFAQLSKRTEAVQRSSDSERTRNAEITAKLADAKAQPSTSRHRDRGEIATQSTQHFPEVKDDREAIAKIKPKSLVEPVLSRDASLGNRFESRKITELPLEMSNVASLLTLQPRATLDGGIIANRADQANLLLDGVDLEPQNSGSGETTICIPNSHLWIRFRIPLETAATHDGYRLIIQSEDGRPVTSIDWSEPLTPDQTLIVTPVISTSQLPSGNYVLLLMGDESKNSFVKVARYSFKIIKD